MQNCYFVIKDENEEVIEDPDALALWLKSQPYNQEATIEPRE